MSPRKMNPRKKMTSRMYSRRMRRMGGYYGEEFINRLRGRSKNQIVDVDYEEIFNDIKKRFPDWSREDLRKAVDMYFKKYGNAHRMRQEEEKIRRQNGGRFE